MATGFLFLQLSSLLHSNIISRVIASVVQKVEKTLYVQIKEFPDTKVSACNNVVNQVYQASSRNSTHIDTRVVLSNLRDSLMQQPSIPGLPTHHTVDKIFLYGREKDAGMPLLKNLAEEFTSEVIVADETFINK
mgnify:CR=1 FL=1